jgi:hypothetical protein
MVADRTDNKMQGAAESLRDSRRLRVVSPEELRSEQHLHVERIVKAIAPHSVTTGAVQGLADWDIRPLVLERGTVHLLRVTDPSLSEHQQSYQQIRSALERSQSADVPLQWGEIPHPTNGRLKQIWMRRIYYSILLSEGRLHGEERTKIINKLFNHIKLLQRFGVIHGHLCSANVAIHEGDIVLMDPLFGCYDLAARKIRNDLAPEIRRGSPATAFSDVFGLGWILRELYQDGIGLTEEKRALLDFAVAENPRERPSFEKMEREFQRDSVFQESPRASSTVGKVISRDGGGDNLSTFSSTFKPAGQEANVQSVVSREGEGGHSSRPPVSLKANSLLGIGFGTFACLAVFVALYQYTRPFSSVDEEMPYELYWQSEDPEKMREVAVAAIGRNDEYALDVIMNAGLAETESRYLTSSILRSGLDPRWRKELVLADKQALLRVAAGPLLPRSLRNLSVDHDTHPGVLFALLSQMNIDSEGKEFLHLKPKHLSRLPEPLGKAFETLGKLGASNLEDRRVRALAHVMSGDVSVPALKAYFDDKDEPAVTLAKLEILKPLVETRKEFAEQLHDYLLSAEGFGGTLVRWFEEATLAVWKPVNKLIRMKIVLGDIDGTIRSFERLADLLTFPRKSIREYAVSALAQDKALQEFSGILQLLASPQQNTLTRTQTISLLAAMTAQGDTAYSFVAKWFSSRPSAAFAAKLLALHTVKRSLDPFQVEAAQYLTLHTSEVTFTDELLTALSLHPEPLARALAYLHLKAENPSHKVILQEALKNETNERMSTELKERLRR